MRPHSSSHKQNKSLSVYLLNTLMEPDKVLERINGLFATDLLPQNPNSFEETKLFLQQVAEILIDYIKEEYDAKSKVLEFHHPSEMAQIVDLSIPDKPMELTQLLQSCRDVLKLCVRTGHPRFFNQLSCGLDLVCMAGEWLTATCNTNMFTYEIAPVFTLMEKEVIRRMIELIGWPEGEGDAIFSPGGALANVYAISAARHHHFPRVKRFGMSSVPTLCAFVSADAHYSTKRAASILGIGTDNCFSIITDNAGQMIPEALEQKIVECKGEGLYPFFVCATAGTTVYGAWDPFHKIADICNRHKVWMHVDAAWGGGLLLSPEHRHKLAGIERAQSITWSPHKLMGALLQCSAIFIRYEGLLLQANQQSAHYLFQKDKPYDCSYDTGDKAIQCGRHNDIFKLWLMWRSKGMEGYRRQVNRLMQLASYFTQRIKNTEGYEMVIAQPEFLNICFWYVPPSLRHLDPKEKAAGLDKIAPKIKLKMMERGTTMVGYQPDPHSNRPNFFRMIISNQAITETDLDFLIDEIIQIGKDM
ncbi:pyridoxal-dependent decarboxylase conserved domain-containing protein [Ditylenchus destructor]|uniref:Pyridoxal-dependent decarboxylase conserved domain-containing protein n=1 Tax=Ditylenchus destructor TaxID=166010 RepID=A0AAD4MI74_9BILA|nr:pyridoxal-dependent decarboxylase conserved domain-containing protein [Ditylenchus destructor]